MNLRLSNLFKGALVVLLALEGLSLLEWILFPYASAGGMIIARLDAGFFDAVIPFSPLVLLLILYAWVFRGTRFLRRYYPSIDRVLVPFARNRDRLLRWLEDPESDATADTHLFRHGRIWLLMAVCYAILLVLTPYRPDLNQAGIPVGIDTPLYIGWIQQMLAGSLGQAIVYAFGTANHGSRPLLLLPLYLYALVSQTNPVQIVEALPLFLGPLSVVSSYVFIRKGHKSKSIAILASLLVVLSFPLSVGMWAGYYANWLGLIEVNLFLFSLLSLSGLAWTRQYGIMAASSLALLLTHPWTWALMIVLALAFALSIWKTDHDRGLLTMIVPLLTTELIVDAAITYLFAGWGVATFVGVRASGSGTSQLVGFWQNLVEGMVYTYNGLLSNSVLLAFAAVAVLGLKFSDRFDRLLFLWVFVASLGFPFLASYNQTRVVYDLPIPILASMGSLLIASKFRDNALSMLILSLFVMFNANYAIRSAIQLAPAFP